MGLFEKKVLIFRKRDRETWEKIREALSKAQIRFSSTSYEQDNIPVGGYSAMDPRNYGRGGRIDRRIYTVSVKASLEQEALEAVRSAGLAAVVEDMETLMQDASKKHSGERY